jgi:hypothetical protein
MSPLDNKYTRWYNQLIDSRKQRIIPQGIYYETHHIIPRSLGGNNFKENKISLLPKEHFVAHLLLTKMFNGQAKYKMWKAFNMMLTENIVDQTRYRPTARYYELARQLVGVASSACNKGRIPWNKGIPQSKKVKDAVSTANKGKITWNKGLVRSETEKQKMKEGWAKKLENGFTPHNKGKKQLLIECEYCKMLVGGASNYARWHGINCKRAKK